VARLPFCTVTVSAAFLSLLPLLRLPAVKDAHGNAHEDRKPHQDEGALCGRVHAGVSATAAQRVIDEGDR